MTLTILKSKSTHSYSVKISQRARIAYPIMLESDLASMVASWLANSTKISAIVIVTEHALLTKAKHLQKIIKHYLLSAKTQSAITAKTIVQIICCPFHPIKTQKNKSTIETQLLKHSCDRDTVLVALGGGSVGDLTGFVAATYYRGIRYVQVPTTLLAMVDSSIGGKTAIDTATAKNALGAIWQPAAVIMDLNHLKTLTQSELIYGLVEAIKIFALFDRQAFLFVEKHREAILQKDLHVLKTIILRAIQLKGRVVKRDERDHGIRQSLNFGHTVGHALEHLAHYRVKHGAAVGLGMIIEAKIAVMLNYLNIKDYTRLVTLLTQLNIAGIDKLKKFNSKMILAQMQHDKKNHDGKIHCVLLERIGKIKMVGGQVTQVVDDKIIGDVLRDYCLLS